MTQNQATTIIVLLAAILFVLIVGRNGALETMDNLWWVLAVIAVSYTHLTLPTTPYV